ncbi:hypothetical protein AZE42_11441 [Rhizopogon vesiculosus]|uniref:Uncharacterized protein n=1 Tax=Rhizopogon vesiculosus TaxID=180088 RepID=A0A1J8QQW3_9AGAM|nr:hypothetical protein AZE42_11441 [Rhizopogon vesiculosus]
MARHFVLFSRTLKPSLLRLFTCITSSLSAVHAFSVTTGPNSPPSTASASSQTSSQRTSGSNTSVVAITVGDAIGGVVFLVLLITLGIRYKRKAAHSSNVTSSPERQISHTDSVTATISPASRGMTSIDGQTVSPDTFQHQNLPVGLVPPVHHVTYSYLTNLSAGNPAADDHHASFSQIQPSRQSPIDGFATHANAGSSSVSPVSRQIAAMPEVVSPNNPLPYQMGPIRPAPPNQPGTLSNPTSTYNFTAGDRDSPLNLSQISPLISNVDSFAMHVDIVSPVMSSSVGRGTTTASQTVTSPPTQIIMPTDIEDDEPLCSTCSALDLCAMLREGIKEEHAVLLGHLTDVFNKYDQCGLCRLIATHIRHTWQLDKQPGINIDGRPCSLYVEASGSLFGETGGADLNDTLPKDICHHLYIKTSTGPRGMYISATMPQSPLTRTLEIRLLEEDASKVGRMKQFHGRRKSMESVVRWCFGGFLERFFQVP